MNYEDIDDDIISMDSLSVDSDNEIKEIFQDNKIKTNNKVYFKTDCFDRELFKYGNKEAELNLLTCQIGNGILNRPCILLCCGINVCSFCIDNLFDYYKNSSIKCPNVKCNKIIKSQDFIPNTNTMSNLFIFPNQKLEEIIEEKYIQCVNNSILEKILSLSEYSLCGWSGLKKDFFKHNQTCSNKVERCRDCGYYFLNSKKDSHQTFHCKPLYQFH
jgi:hypothetical protein